jgi:thiamine-phosphate pyrophosphorylase
MLAYAVQLREKLPGKTLILSERADIAICAGFEGVHLNAETLPPHAVKESFPGLITGYSAHSPDECAITGADYVTLSPIFSVRKGYNVSPLGVIPAPASGVYALGGVNADTVSLLKGMGYEGVAGVTMLPEIERIRRII